MNTIHVASGVGVADTAMASYDAALADANLHNYNLVAVSSVVPAKATVEAVDEVPDLGPAGDRLTVVRRGGRSARTTRLISARADAPAPRTPSRSAPPDAVPTWPPGSAGRRVRVPASFMR